MCEEELEPIPVTVTVGRDGNVTLDTGNEFYVNWKREDWAQAQMDAAAVDLEKPPEYVEPFLYFIAAMTAIAPHPGTKLLDVGCGVGLYAALIDRHFPQVEYTGFDFSEPMIEQARKNFSPHEFFVADFRDVDYSKYDIVLVSGLITIAPEFKEIVDLISEQCKDIVIWHRIFLTDDPRPVYPVIAGAYTGKKNYHFFFNQRNFTSYLVHKYADVRLCVWAEERKTFRIGTYICAKHSLDKSSSDVSGTETRD